MSFESDQQTHELEASATVHNYLSLTLPARRFDDYSVINCEPRRVFFPGAVMKIEDIPTEHFLNIIRTLVKNGWQLIYEFDGFIAWIDYGEVHLRKDEIIVKFFWDNWTEGEIVADGEIEEVRALL